MESDGGTGASPQPPAHMGGAWTKADREAARQPIPPRSSTHRVANAPSVTGQINMRGDRHALGEVRHSAISKAVNTVADDWVPVHDEIDAIGRGDGSQVPDTKVMVNDNTYEGVLYEIRNRRYVVQRDGHAYPFDGPGLYRMTEFEFQFLKSMIATNGHPVGVANLKQIYGNAVDPDAVSFIEALASRRWVTE